MSSTIIILWIAAISELQTGGIQEALDKVTDSSRQVTPAIQIEKFAPKYPTIELREGNEAWVHITYCIDESGSPQNISVLDSVGGSRFDKAAINTVKRWKYEPALIDGKPSWQSRNQVYVSFAIEGDNKGAGRKFIGQFRKLGKLIEEDKMQEADELFLRIYETYDLSLYELSKLWAQRVRYEVAVGDKYKLDMALHRATASSGAWIDQESYVQLLSLRVIVELQIGQYHAAFQAFDELIDAVGNDSEEVLALQPTVDKLKVIIDSDEVIKINAEVRTKDDCNYCNNSWHFTPVRNDFTFINVVGKLESIEMRCDHKRFESDVSDLVEWHIPENWGTCHIQVYGDPGTTFDLVLLSDVHQ